jgi:hypothetical protein
MTTIVGPDTGCFQDLLTLEATGVDGADRVEWITLEQPVGSQVTFGSPGAALTTIEVSEDGQYTFEACAYYDEGDPGDQINNEAIALNCPLSAIGGNLVTITATGCEDRLLTWNVSGVPVTSFTASGQSVAITTDPLGAGGVIASVTCEDADGNVEALSCSFVVIPAAPAPDIEFVTGPQTEVTAVTCGTSCVCDQHTVTFNCGVDSEECAELGLVFLDCPDCPPDAPCEDIERVEFLGVEAAQITACEDILACCDTEICCDPHMPVLMWNNLCSCPGWTIDAPAAEGSSFYNACSCNTTSQWCFDGTATIVASGPAQFVDVMVIWGHNIADGSVTTSPLSPFGGGATGVGVVTDGACIPGYTQPVVINFDGVNAAITDFTATITSADGGPVCIDQVFIGQKLFLPDDRLPLNFVNPHDGDDYELEFKEAECGGILSQSIKHVACDWELQICADDDWICEYWRPFLRYARRHGFMFQWSRNRKPNDIINAWLPNKQQGSVADENNDVIVTLNARGFITQPQQPVFV